MGRLKDLTGMKFGRLTVIERAENDKYGRCRWKCKCSCNNETVVSSTNLLTGAVKSCGCLGGRLKDLTGQKFGRLTVIERAENTKNGAARWKCRCSCGAETVVQSANLLSGVSTSCGCFNKETVFKHGMSYTKIYHVWDAIKQRCLCPDNKSYHNYGGRDISICAEWKDDFKSFFDYVSQLEHFGDKNYSLDRIDNDGNYEPGNLRFADRKTQQRNRRGIHYVEYNGELTILSEAAELSGIDYSTLFYRIKRGWTGDELFKPVKK